MAYYFFKICYNKQNFKGSTMPIQQISLYYKDGSSDKVYHLQIEEQTPGYVVNFQYGKRGSTLTAGSKTKDPVNLEEAQKAYSKLIKEKMGKGYTEGESGAVFQSQSLEERFTGIVPQLLNEITDDELPQYLNSNEWYMEEKYDGRRLLIEKKGQNTTAINKKGLAILIPQKVIDLINSVPQDITLDGEIIGENYYIFDILEFNGEDVKNRTFKERLQLRNSISQLSQNFVKTYTSPEDKKEFFERLKAQEKEGAVFKKMSSLYVSGRPASGGNQMKYKFWASATVEVVSNHKTKRSVGVALYDGNDKKLMGSVTIPANYDIPTLGQIVEVIYLYCHVGGALYQTKYKGVRDDQNLQDCKYSQLKFKAAEDDDEEPVVEDKSKKKSFKDSW